MRLFLARLAPHRAALLLSALLLLVSAVAPAASVFLLRDALSRLQRSSLSELALSAALFVGVYLAQSIANVWRTALTKRVSFEVASALRRELHAAFLGQRSSGTIGERLASLLDEADQIQYGVSAIVTAARNPITLLLLLAASVALSPTLAAASVVLFAPALLASLWAQGRVRRLSLVSRERRAALWRLSAEQLRGIDVLRAFGATEDEKRRFTEADAADRAARLHLEIARVLPSALVEVLAAAALAGLLLFGATEVSAGRADSATLVAFVVAGVLVHRPVTALAEVSTLLTRSLVALQRIVDEIARSAPPPPPSASPPLLPTPPIALSWDQISLHFGDRPLFEGFTATAPPDHLTALVGPSGAGKTTLLQLASGQLPPTRGRITLGDIDLSSLPPEHLPHLIAVVPQDNLLFSRTLLENIALSPTPDPQRATEALLAAGAAFALAKPGGLHATLEENGRSLSGGERSRICLARALYRRTPLLLLDEPTAHLDAENSRALVETLLSLRQGRTIVVATHDPLVWQHATPLLKV